MRFDDLYERMTPEQRVSLAKRVGKSPAYLWQIANRWQGRRPSLELISALAKAEKRLTVAGLVSEFVRESETSISGTTQG